jgi:hypothetical protein
VAVNSLKRKISSSNLLYKDITSFRKFGVELEVSNNISKKKLKEVLEEYESDYSLKKKKVIATLGKEGWAQTRKNNYWHIKFDRTCGDQGKFIDHGWEIASYIGQGINDIFHIARLARFLKNRGVYVNKNCGLHIHVDVSDFNVKNMGILLSRWLKIEDHLFSIVGPSRRYSPYCVPLRNKIDENKIFYNEHIPEFVWEFLKPKNLKIHNNPYKKVSLNTVGFAVYEINKTYDRSTVELRLPECLLNEIHVRNWIKIILNFVDTCRKEYFGPENLNSCNNIKEILYYLGLLENDEFLILSPDLLASKLWFLEKIAHSGTAKISIKKQAKKYFNYITNI